MAQIDVKLFNDKCLVAGRHFNDFQVEVLNRLESIHEQIDLLDKRMVKQETLMQTLFGFNGEPGKLTILHARIDKQDRKIERIKNLLWPIVGAICLLAWIGIAGVRQMLK